MKKIIALALCAIMLTAMAALGVSASVSFAEAIPGNVGTLVVEKGAALEDIAEYYGTVPELKAGGGHFCCKADCWVRYEFNAEKAGTYTFAVQYAAPANVDTRAINYSIDSAEVSKQQYVKLDFTDPGSDYSTIWYMLVTAELTAGTHSFYILTPTGFDDSTIKSYNIHGLSVYLTEEAQTAAPADDTGVASAPQTADTVMISAAALAVSAAAVVVAKKRGCRNIEK